MFQATGLQEICNEMIDYRRRNLHISECGNIVRLGVSTGSSPRTLYMAPALTLVASLSCCFTILTLKFHLDLDVKLRCEATVTAVQ